MLARPQKTVSTGASAEVSTKRMLPQKEVDRVQRGTGYHPSKPSMLSAGRAAITSHIPSSELSGADA